MDVIKSRNNNILKHSRKLKIKKYREENKEFMIEGLRFVEEAVLSDAPVKYCLLSENLKGDRIDSLMKNMAHKDIMIYRVNEEFLNDICETKTPQGIVAVVEKREVEVDSLLKNMDFIVLVDRIQDPGNLGTIIRTADASGVDAICMSEGTVDPYSSKVLRSTMGSIFHLPLVHCQDMIAFIERLKEEGFRVYASALEGSIEYYKEDYTIKTALVIGNEANGVTKDILDSAHGLIKIPMPGRAESLNAAVAGGILMFEVAKQRNIDKL